jgi:hypothetical protein
MGRGEQMGQGDATETGPPGATRGPHGVEWVNMDDCKGAAFRR